MLGDNIYEGPDLNYKQRFVRAKAKPSSSSLVPSFGMQICKLIIHALRFSIIPPGKK
jgi:hypothetical protein